MYLPSILVAALIASSVAAYGDRPQGKQHRPSNEESGLVQDEWPAHPFGQMQTRWNWNGLWPSHWSWWSLLPAAVKNMIHQMQDFFACVHEGWQLFKTDTSIIIGDIKANFKITFNILWDVVHLDGQDLQHELTAAVKQFWAQIVQFFKSVGAFIRYAFKCRGFLEADPQSFEGMMTRSFRTSTWEYLQ